MHLSLVAGVRRGLPLLRTMMLVVGLVSIGNAAGAAPEAEPGGTVVALAYDTGAGALLKAYPHSLYRSGDEGRTWERIALPEATEAGSIAAVATPAKGGAIYVAGSGLGVMRSDNGGNSWTALGEGLAGEDVAAFATHATEPDTLYAYLPEKGIYRSKDAGRSWRLMDRGPDAIRQIVHSGMAGSMETGWLYVATEQGASLSMDCFCFWREIGEFGGPVSAIAVDLRQPERVYAASGNGLFVSKDGGRAWEPAASPGPPVTALTVTSSGVVYAAAATGALFLSRDLGASWVRVDA